ncbi:MAG: hypothetical protein CM15mP58_03990 [Burkholderiaceae bacterium]|nr:MAG: hypothetical protein CM15mP58_03990 [Burkholderiaceae bacterium]
MQFIIPALLPPTVRTSYVSAKSGGALVSFEIKDPTRVSSGQGMENYR